MKLLKRLLIGLAIAFVLFYVITRPQEAANVVQTVFDWILGAINAVVNFFIELVSR